MTPPKQSQPRLSPAAKKALNNIAACAVLLFLLLLGITLWQPSALAASGMLELLRFVMALLPAFASAILLYGWFDNYAAVNGKLFGLEVRLGGPAALMVAVVLLAYWLIPAPALEFSWSLYLHAENDEGSHPLRNFDGLTLEVGGKPETAHIDDYGRALFERLPSKYRSQTLPVSLRHDVYALAQNKVTLTGERGSLALRVKRVPLAGTVRNESGAPLPGVKVWLSSNTAHSVQSDANGGFQFQVAADSGEISVNLQAAGYQAKNLRVPVLGAPSAFVLLRE